ncbi:hypothetical protein GCM10009765_77790 [Fodinicola feengrottensis]|uniref:Uncharacterized protein n=1 Tax=Fodinicola feengrottensis TaxID=435914 RepID=A0ABN2J4C5_9ACTN
MFVVVPVVYGVAMPVVDVVDVLAMGDSDVTAAGAVSVRMCLVGHMCGRLTLVEMAVVLAVQMSVVRVVDVAGMRHGDMSAPLLMSVIVAGVLGMCAGHSGPP